MAWLAANLPALMFVALALLLLSGVPVVFGLAACGLGFAAVGIQMGLMPAALLQALPLRLIGIMTNELLLAIPFFTLMGLILDRCGLARDLLETIGQVFGPLRGGLAFAVVLVGALLGASTGVIAASVISMGLISLPLMLRHGYDARVACGVIAASGSLTQIVPPSLVLIVLADQLNRGVGDLYAAALLPAAMVIGGNLLLVAGFAYWCPTALPALPADARAPLEVNGRSGLRSLAVLMGCGVVASTVFMQAYPALVVLLGRTVAPPPADERTIVALAVTVFSAFVLATLDRVLRLGWLSALAQRVAFVLMPPLILIFLVLGTIYIGLATPTEAGALGVLGALAMAAGRRRLQRVAMIEASLTALKLSCFVIFILIGSTVFTHTFNSLDGSAWVAKALGGLPGGATGMLVFVMALVFVLGFFLDFFEIAFVLVPLLAPVAEGFGIDLVWFGVLLCINLQTSFLTPPFGYALFFLRGVTPHEDHVDAGGHRIRGVTTAEIYRGALPFTAVPLAVIALLIAFPGLVLLSGAPAALSEAEVESILRSAEPGPDAARADDPLERRLEAIGRER